jgi:hypothetical protein
MIVIRSIDAVEIDDNLHVTHLDTCVPCDVVGDPGSVDWIEHSVYREYIEGRWFVRPDGKRLLIGNSKQASEIIGLQFEAWQNMEKSLDDCRKARRELEAELKPLRAVAQAGFWTRIKWVFFDKFTAKET